MTWFEEVDSRGEIIEKTDEAVETFGTAWGAGVIGITREQIDAILSGKCFAFDDGEYVHFVVLV